MNPFHSRKRTKKESQEDMWDDYFEEKYPGYKERKRKRETSDPVSKFVEALNPPPPPPPPVPEPPPSLIGRRPANPLINSAEDIVDRHRTAIAKFDHEAITDDIRSFGQTEFERGIEFAMKMNYLANPKK